MINFIFDPFVHYAFLSRALWACILISMMGGFIGSILVLRRMSLMGDALSHGILPGTAVAFYYCGYSIYAMTVGALIAGLLVAFLSHFIAKKSVLHEDASFTGIYLISLAAGVFLLSIKGGNLTHFLFGNVLAVSPNDLYLIGSCTFLVVIIMSYLYYPLVYDCFDPIFSHNLGIDSNQLNRIFLILIVVALVGTYQVLGTLMALGLLILPSIIARLWAKHVSSMIVGSMIIGSLCSFTGLRLSYEFNWPTSSTIILILGLLYLLSFALIQIKKGK
jgi:zinc/manganese transport system permease protein